MGNTDRETIIRLVAEGKITADEGAKLIEAVGAATEPKPNQATLTVSGAGEKRRGKARFLRVIVKADGMANTTENGAKGDVDVDVNLPINLARRLAPMLDGMIPQDAKSEMEKHGVDMYALAAMLESLDEDMEGRDLVNVNVSGDAGDDEKPASGNVKVRVYVE